MTRVPIRLRLTLAAAISAGIVLAVAGLYVYGRVQARLDSSIDQALRQRAADVANLAVQADGALAEGRASGVDSDETFAEIFSSRGRISDATPATRGRSLLPTRVLERARRAPTVITRTRFSGRSVRVLATPVTVGRNRIVIAVAVPLEDRDDALATLAAQLLLALPAAMGLITIGGYLLAGAALRPVRDLAGAAEAISQASPTARVPVPRARDEIAALGATLNRMLARLEDSAQRERRFVADASHELRTPLALLKSELEVTFRGPRRLTSYETALRDAAENVDGLAQLADDLLLLARADERRLDLHTTTVDPHDLAGSLARRFAQRASAQRRPIEVDSGEATPFAADAGRITQALTNLVENALRYGIGTVAIRIRDDGESVLLGVRDGGPGPPPAFLPLAFERFTRADPSRTKSGSGLGLAIVAVVADAHGGETYAANTPDGFEAGIRIPR